MDGLLREAEWKDVNLMDLQTLYEMSEAGYEFVVNDGTLKTALKPRKGEMV